MKNKFSRGLVVTILMSSSLVAQVILEKKEGPAFIWIEAERGDIHAPMKVFDRRDASGGQYIEVSTGNYSVHSAPDDGQTVYRFTVAEAGTYKVWGRVIASMSDENAYWAKIDNGRWVKWADISLGCEWHWDEIHDNENQNQVMEYFLAPGSHELTITYLVDDVKLDKVLITNDSAYIPTGKGPRADALFSYNPSTPVMQNTVRFDGSASLSTKGKIVAYDWDFGDGSTAAGAKPRHRFSIAGEYPVKLIVTDDTGLTGRLTKKVKVYAGQPVADYHFWPDHAKPGEVVRFDASNSLAPKGHITHYAWTFGDGTTGDGAVVKHTYTSAGEYTVALTVRDDQGKTAREEQKVAIINPVSKKVIYETDMCLDVDDVGGLAILHAMADRGEAEILAVCFNEVHPSGAAAIDAVNTWYGRGDMPVGVYKDNLFEPDYSGYLEELAKFPHDLDKERAASALDTYRQVLSDQPDRSVTIISVGFLNNLNDLLNAEPTLVEHKVKELVIMGGLINDGFNLSRHRLVTASQNVIENWPTPLVISGPGSSILTGTTLEGVSEKNPVRTAYYEFFGSNYCARPSWDQIAVLYGVRGRSTYFKTITKGKGVLPNGYTWQMKPGVRSYLETRLSDDHYAKIVENLMTVPPNVQETPAMPRHVPENWLTYHLAHPGPGVGMPGDPNPAYYYKGLYHLHYIYENNHGHAFAHVSSRDMVRWQWHPTVLVEPNTGHGMFSGTGFFTKDGQPAMIYHGEGSDNNYLAFALDDRLDQWSKPRAVEPKTASGQPAQIRMWDPDCWLKDDTYYAISGGEPPHLMKSSNLKDWVYLGLLLHENMPDLGVSPKEDVSCANMFKLGDKWMLLCISHDLGCRYYLGDFRDERYLPEFHALMNWKDRDVFAPESLLTPDGRRVMWAWCNLEGPQSAIQSLPRELSLPADGVLRIKPLRELESLRYDEQNEGDITVKANHSHLLERLSGDTVELDITLKPTNAVEYGVSVFCEKSGQGFPITIKPDAKVMTMGDIKPPFELKKDEDLQLRIFLDRSMVEVFINDRQAAVYMQKHDKDHVGIRLFSTGGDLTANVKGWKMKSIYTSQ